MNSIAWLEANTFITVYGRHSLTRRINWRQQTCRIHYKRSTVAISEMRIHILREVLIISLFSLMYCTISTFIKLNNFDTRRLNGPRHLFPSFCCTTQHIFYPLRVYEPGFNTDKYGKLLILCNLLYNPQ